MEYICKKCGEIFNDQKIYAFHCGRHTLSEKAENYVDEFVEIKRNCLKCGKEFTIKARKSRKDGHLLFYDTPYCSRACANTREHSKETKEKISEGLKGKTCWYKDGRTKVKKFV